MFDDLSFSLFLFVTISEEESPYRRQIKGKSFSINLFVYEISFIIRFHWKCFVINFKIEEAVPNMLQIIQ